MTEEELEMALLIGTARMGPYLEQVSDRDCFWRVRCMICDQAFCLGDSYFWVWFTSGGAARAHLKCISPLNVVHFQTLSRGGSA